MRLSEFDRTLDRLDYPTTTTELLQRFQDVELSLQDGTERLEQLLELPGHETYASTDEVRMTVYGALPVEAIGRQGYTDRDPPGVGEVEPVSF